MIPGIYLDRKCPVYFINNIIPGERTVIELEMHKSIDLTGNLIKKVFLLLCVTGIISFTCCSTTHKDADLVPTIENPPQTENKPPQTIEDRWGIKIKGIHLSAGGYMLDFRYEIIDPDKARPILDMKIKPCLIDQATGVKMMVPDPPKVGQLRAHTMKPLSGKIYYIIFANPGYYIKKGRRVTVVVGDFKAENLIVE